MGDWLSASREDHVKCHLSLVTTSYTASLNGAGLTCKLYAVKSVAYVMAVFRVSNQSLLLIFLSSLRTR